MATATDPNVHLYSQPLDHLREGGLTMPEARVWQGRQGMVDDMVAMFEHRPRRDVREVGTELDRLPMNEVGLGARSEMVQDARALAKFSRSYLRDVIEQSVQGDATLATRMALEMAYWAQVARGEQNPNNPGQGGGGGFAAALGALQAGLPQSGNGMGDLMEDLLNEAGAQLVSEANESGGQDGDDDGEFAGKSDRADSGEGGRGAGGGANPLQALGRGLHLLPLIRKMTLKYERAKSAPSAREKTFVPEDDVDLRPARLDEIPIVGDLMLDDDLFFLKLASGGLSAFQHWKISKEDLSRTYAMAIDVSGSMKKKYGRYTGADLACASAIALLQNALAGGNKTKLIFFDTACHEVKFDRPTEAVKILMTTPFAGGGTSIRNALTKLSDPEYDEAIIITDGDDSGFSHVKLQIPLYSVLIGQNNAQLAEMSRDSEVVRAL